MEKAVALLSIDLVLAPEMTPTWLGDPLQNTQEVII